MYNWVPAGSHNGLNRAHKKAQGAVLVDGKHVGDTLRCVHCSAHWVHQEGSGARRGYCTHCKGFVCGQATCDDCIPLEKKLEGWEQGKTKADLLRELDGMPITLV